MKTENLSGILVITKVSKFDNSEVETLVFPITNEADEQQMELDVQKAEAQFTFLIETYEGKFLSEDERIYYIEKGFYKNEKVTITLTWAENY